MTYFVIENFGRGLDVRKHIFNLPPGCLFRGKNININRGGEPESAKAFVLKYALPVGQTFGLLSAGGKLWTFGSAAAVAVPAGIQYQQCALPGGTMTGVVWATPIKGKPFVIATFTNGYGVFFNGVLIQDWQPTLPAGGSMSDVATGMAAAINASAVYTATAAGAVVTITGRPGIPFTIAATATNAGGVNDQTATVATTQNAAPATAGGLASGSFGFSGVTPDWNDSINGGAGGYVPRGVTGSVKVNGVEVLGTTIVANDDAGAAAAVCNYINLYHSAPDYTATVSGTTVTLTALAGTGATPNGWVIDAGSPYSGNGVMGGGGDPTPAIPQISTVTFGGTYEVTDTFSVTLAGTPYTVATTGGGATPTKGQNPTAALVKNGKTYAIAGPNLFGSKIGDCTQWNPDPSPAPANGSFVTDMSTEIAGADILTALAYFQGNLAIFSRSTVQIEFVDPDPTLNEQVQTLQNIGTMAPKSVLSYGDSDVFFLSDTGIRSLKVRVNTDNATLSDIGSPIDPLVIAAIKASIATAQKSCSAIEPVDGRFLLQIGTTTYVFSYFPDAKVAAWTTYETGLSLVDFAVLETRLYARDTNNVYLLGGDGNDIYSPQAADIKIPFISARQISTLKHFTALDVTCDGTFDVSISTDPLQPDTEEVVATINGTTFGLGKTPILGEDVTALSLRFKGRPSKYGRLSNIAIHHEALGENA